MELEIPDDWNITKIVNSDGVTVGYVLARPDFDVGVQLISKQSNGWSDSGNYLYGSTEESNAVLSGGPQGQSDSNT